MVILSGADATGASSEHEMFFYVIVPSGKRIAYAEWRDDWIIR